MINNCMLIDYNSKHPEILDFVKYHKNGKPFLKKYKIKCARCERITTTSLSLFLNRYDANVETLCRSCSKKTEKNLAIYRKNISKLHGKPYIELYGEKKATEMKNRLRVFAKNHPSEKFKNCGRHQKGKRHSNFGKSWEELMGAEKSSERKIKASHRNSGNMNNMYGKPTPKKAGNGICGWYKNWFFRSLLELSFMINYIEKYKKLWESAESKKYRISYIDYKNSQRTYRPDFIIDGTTLVEIKPFKLLSTPLNMLKQEAGKIFCDKNGLLYKTFSEKDFNRLNWNDLKNLLENKQIILLKKHQEAYILKNI